VRRNLVALLGTLSSLVLLFTYPTSRNVPAAHAATAAPSASATGAGAKTYTGHAVSTAKGVIQVQITVTNGKLTAARAVRYADSQANASALPILAKETVAARSARIEAVSGATVTSNGYLESLQSALDAAHL
jgi:uncharacterized protein with FMN-binding domain